jgi:succinate dehydrogenase / fumarate reductase cytochrome b subunit
MQTKVNLPSAARFWAWFNPLGRQTGSWAFILNRITALGLAFYLYMHLIVLSQLSQGSDAWEAFLILAHSPIFKVGELLVIAAGILHGLNGIRIVLTTLSIGVTHQKHLFYAALGVSILVILLFALRMFSA